MKAIIAGLCIALAPAATWGQSLPVSSVIPTMGLTVGSARAGRLPPLAMATGKLIAPAITGARPEAPAIPVALSLRPQCNMPVARAGTDSGIPAAGRAGIIENRAIPILTQRAGCVNAFANQPNADTVAIAKP